MELRPKVAKLVAELERAAVDWGGVMLSWTQTENAAFLSKEPISNIMGQYEFEFPIEQRYRRNLWTVFGCPGQPDRTANHL